MVWMPVFASKIVQHNSNILNESKKILKFKDAVMTTEKLLWKKKKYIYISFEYQIKPTN